jgi:hypothetical protein
MKSIAHVVFSCGIAFNGTTPRAGTRFFVRRTWFNPSAQYTR